MADHYELDITTNTCEFPYTKKYSIAMTLGDLKKKLELIVGAEAESIDVELRDNEGKFVAALVENSKSLKDLGVKNGMQIHGIDRTHKNEELKDDSMVEKYEISEDKYEQRQDSVRAFKKRLAAEKMAKEGQSASSPPDPFEQQNEALKHIQVGQRCEVRIKDQPPRRGHIAFVGQTKFKEGPWVGIAYDEPVGKNDGTVAGVRYFQVDDKYGGFARPSDVVIGDFPPLFDMNEI
ncbi:hypothetical protein WR25_13066 isoform A [Diploscapter pachys]|uniref:CAP-Gly domain-containing protein n=1 Tax=Diploscapter pachys TaxID=2018661 RepID=A0A2A2J2E9_9BILA|nr:hypothetical protein WR25_13066 isoform A [Diploscapter pachys]